MPAPGRLTIVAALPPLAGFRRAVAVESAPRPRAVVLSFAPPAVTGDPARRDALLRAVAAAGRVQHRGVAAVLGVETVDGTLAVLEEHRPGTSLRILLDAAGRTPPDVAAHVGAEVASALAAIQAIELEGTRLGHGALDAAGVVVGDRGEVTVCGLGLVAGANPAADLRALGAVLHECVAGEPPGDPPRPLDVPGVPAALAAAVDRASGATTPAHEGPAALATALAGAAPSAASPADVAAYVDVIVPPHEGERAGLRAAVAIALDRAGGPPPPRPAAGGVTPPDSPRTFPRPPAPAARSRLPVVVGVVALAIGFAAGFGAQRTLGRAPASPAVAPTSEIRIRPERAAEAAAPPAAAPVPAPAPPAAVPAAPTSEPERAAPRPGKRAAPAPKGRGTLDVTAPPDADVLLDGKRIGSGNVRAEVATGAHRIEVRRNGAVVRERFSVAAGETWTYAVTPTPEVPAAAASGPSTKAP